MAICGNCGHEASSFTEALIEGKPKTVCTKCAANAGKPTNESANTPLQKING